MTERDLVAELADRAQVAPEQVRAVLDALAEVTCEHERAGQALPLAALGLARCYGFRRAAAPSPAQQPCDASVEQLIADARRHPLGIEFLLEGEPGCVAATFGTHAFTVDAARQRLGSSNG